ncbi:hypothetical protein QJQ45_011482 [Haematococcus lacustris]|nr:hypothetical protein QJQ45_011482 [Haematococcus lacustris]
MSRVKRQAAMIEKRLHGTTNFGPSPRLILAASPSTPLALARTGKALDGTFLKVYQQHITFTLAIWDAVWEVYQDSKWARQRLRLYGDQDQDQEQFLQKLEEDMAEVSMERNGHAKQLVVFFSAVGIGIRRRLGADAVVTGGPPAALPSVIRMSGA